MATNPMQRKARNSFILGIVITLVITGAVIAFLLIQLINMQKEQEALEASYVNVVVLNRDVESGEEITVSDLTQVQTTSDVAPTNAISIGNLGETNIARINLSAGTIVSSDMLYIDATTTGDDVRQQEYNMIVLPTDLETGDYVDIRLMLPTGQDYIVVSKKQVEIPVISGVTSSDTIWIEVSEDEILMMSSAIVDAYMIEGSKLYATKYTEPGNQEAAEPTYAVTAETLRVIESDSNIVDEARTALRARYNTTFRTDINSAIALQDDAQANEQEGMSESIEKSQTTREEYLQSLAASTTTTE